MTNEQKAGTGSICANGHTIRYTKDINGLFWYFASDVGKAAGFSNTSVAMLRVPPEHRQMAIVGNAHRGNTYITVSHAGLSALLYGTRKGKDAPKDLAVAIGNIVGMPVAPFAAVLLPPVISTGAAKSFAASISDVFTFEGLNLRTVTDKDGNPWFYATDLCKILGLTDTNAAVESVDDDDRAVISISDQNQPSIYSKRIKGVQSGRSYIVLNESGLYTLLVRSHKPNARVIAKWITSKILPSVRKTGTYVDPGVHRTAVALPEPKPVLAQPVQGRRELLGFEELLLRQGIKDTADRAPTRLRAALCKRMHGDLRKMLGTGISPWRTARVGGNDTVDSVIETMKAGYGKYLALLPPDPATPQAKALAPGLDDDWHLLMAPGPDDDWHLLMGYRFDRPHAPSNLGYNAAFLEKAILDWSLRVMANPVTLSKSAFGCVANALGVKDDVRTPPPVYVTPSNDVNGVLRAVYYYPWDVVKEILAVAEAEGLIKPPVTGQQPAPKPTRPNGNDLQYILPLGDERRGQDSLRHS